MPVKFYVKFYTDVSRFAGVISANPICSDYIVRCKHANGLDKNEQQYLQVRFECRNAMA